jgi:hypothetical protein
MKFISLLVPILLFVGCAGMDIVNKQAQYDGQVLSTSSIEGNSFYDSLVSAVKAEHPWNSKELESYGKPDYIFSESLFHFYLAYKNPIKIIQMDVPIAGNIKFKQLDFIPNNFKPYLEDSALILSAQQKIDQLEMGMKLEDFLILFPDASLLQHKMDLYEDTKEPYERKDYMSDSYSFLFADGLLVSYKMIGL